MKLHLVSPLREGGANILGKLLLPPLNLMYLAACTPPNIEVEIIDENDRAIEFSERPRLVGISTLTATVARAYEIATRFRALGSKVVLGGVHASMLPDEALRYADSVVIGEAEGVWPKVVADAADGTLEPVYREDEPLAFETPLFPRRDLIRSRAYWSANAVQSSRGCPHDCIFCTVTALNGKRYRVRKAESVLEEIEALPVNPLVKRRIVAFVDAEAAPSKARAKELYRGLKSLKAFWGSRASISFADDEELVALAAESGCRFLVIGLQGLLLGEGALRTDDERVQQYQERLRLLDRYGISAICDFRFGFDGDNDRVLENALKFAERAQIPLVRFMNLKPYPGTRIYKRLSKEGRIEHDYWFDPAWESRFVFEPRRMDGDDLLEKIDEIHQRFYRFTSTVERMPRDSRTCFLLPLNLLYRLATWARSRGLMPG